MNPYFPWSSLYVRTAKPISFNFFLKPSKCFVEGSYGKKI